MTAALDQLLAALSDISGTKLTTPIVVLVRVDDEDGLCMFHADVDPEEIPILLTQAALMTALREPDVLRSPEDDPE